MNKKNGIAAEKSPLVFDAKFHAYFLKPQYWSTWFFLVLSYLIFLLPNKLVDLLGNCLGDLLRKINKKRLAIAYKNLDLCYPEMSENERQFFLKNHFRAQMRSILHYGFILWGSKKSLQKRIEFQGQENIDAAIAAGHNVIVMTIHSVGLEAAVSALGRAYSVSGPFKSMKNPVADWIVARARSKFGTLIYTREAGLRPIIKDVRSGCVMCYLPDEDLGKERSIFVPLFDVPKATIPVLGRLAKSCRAKVFPCVSCYDTAQAKYQVHILPPLDNFPLGDDQLDTQTMNQAIEQLINICPEQYFWTLRLFKTRPEGEQRFY
ncbi:MAG: lipid A biosynthesis acyltransferase [Gammaproteobacteria bacterium]|nr:lipid A biosynthesis acyltransferase [Gammaproteobacteria bacterium]